jgi:hypothetical protein
MASNATRRINASLRLNARQALLRCPNGETHHFGKGGRQSRQCSYTAGLLHSRRESLSKASSARSRGTNSKHYSH